MQNNTVGKAMITYGREKSSYSVQLDGLLEMTAFIVNTMYVTHIMKIIACTTDFSYPFPPLFRTIVVFVYFGDLYCKQYGPRPGFIVVFCLHDKITCNLSAFEYMKQT